MTDYKEMSNVKLYENIQFLYNKLENNKGLVFRKRIRKIILEMEIELEKRLENTRP